jgi:hypothetical protein
MNELEAGMGIFKQLWQYAPYEAGPPGPRHRQTPDTRHSDLGYAVMRGRGGGLRRYWRFRAIIRNHPLKTAYREALIREAQSMLDAMREWTEESSEAEED